MTIFLHGTVKKLKIKKLLYLRHKLRYSEEMLKLAFPHLDIACHELFIRMKIPEKKVIVTNGLRISGNET
jgi:hypothetical protein